MGIDHLAWADGGSTITWGLGSSFFRLPLADVNFDGSEEERKLPVEEIVAVVQRPRHIPKGIGNCPQSRAVIRRQWDDDHARDH